jgi:hypothetical protein
MGWSPLYGMDGMDGWTVMVAGNMYLDWQRIARRLWIESNVRIELGCCLDSVCDLIPNSLVVEHVWYVHLLYGFQVLPRTKHMLKFRRTTQCILSQE